VQTSEDPEIVQALQAHAAEVTELVDEGMIAMMRGMMESGRGRMQGMQGMHGMHGMGGMGGDGGMMP
jgi:metal-dependent HD superfamily phosphatase/phosphodiesterase